MFRCLLSTFVLFFLTTATVAQDRPNTILVLDGSGSMWGQIDGVAKITIAQDVVTRLLGSIPPEQQLGLTVYGHRRRGDCSDIETVVPPGAGTRAAIAGAVATIKPLGKTPMTDAVVAAAQALRYTEEKATVILVSDGVETCNPDPCAAARLLNEAGIDFTAHVVGFDVGNDPPALAQMQCIADETGGTFRSAENADELAEALIRVAAEPDPEPEPIAIQFRAELAETGQIITDGLVWQVSASDGRQAPPLTEATPAMAMFPGTYAVTVTRTEDGAIATSDFFVEKLSKTVVLKLPKITLRAILDAPDSAPMGSVIDVTWEGPADKNDLIEIAQVGHRRTAYVNTKTGNPATLQMPPVAGAYELRYVHGQTKDILATRPIDVTPVTATLDAAGSAPAGSHLPVTWSGPDYKNDFISVAPSGQRTVGYAYTNKGSPATVRMPAEPGEYELRYVMNLGETILITRPVTVTPVSATLEAPAGAIAGQTIAVDWSGPNYKSDYISVAKPGERTIRYTYSKTGSPVQIEMPNAPGTYELRYVMALGDTVLATRSITVSEVGAVLEAPDTATAGSTVPVDWTGPDYPNDYVAVGKPGERYSSYAYSRRGSPAQIVMPNDPGTYELRYVLGQGDKTIATRPITVTKVGAVLEAQAEAKTGETIAVTWQGPDYQNDYLAVGKPGEKYTAYTYSRRGSPAQIEMPTEPGDYELRYVLNQGSEVLATRPIKVLPIEVTLDGPAQAVAGSTIDVPFVGPDYENDYVGIGPVGERYVNYAYTKRGNPAKVLMPVKPGAYELRYYLNQGDTVMATRPITVAPVTAILEAQDIGFAGSVLNVDWQGPDYLNDYIAVGEPGKKYVTYAYTKRGSPAQITLPDEPGQYEIRYILNQGATVIATRPLQIVAE